MKEENKTFLKEQINSSIEALEANLVEARNQIKALKLQVEETELLRDKLRGVVKEL